jgi:hypothetical protein
MKSNYQSVIEVMVGFAFIFLTSIFLLGRIEKFPDFENYDRIIQDGNYWIRYIGSEPLSALLMWISEGGEQGGLIYYILSWFISIFVIFHIAFKYYQSSWITVSVFLLFNPLHIIAFQVPRHFMGMVIFLFVLHTTGYRKWIYVVSVFLFQNAIGIFVGVYAIIKKLHGLTIISANILMVFLYYVIAISYYEVHLNDEVSRGRGLLAYMVVTLIVFSVVTWKRKDDWSIVFSLAFLSVFFYTFSPVAYRFFEVVITFAILSAFKHSCALISKKLLKIFSWASVMLSIFVVNLGFFGF